MELIILAYIVLSVVIAVFSAIGNFINKKTVTEGCDYFFDSFFGGLLGGFVGVLICIILEYLFYLSIYSYSSSSFYDIEYFYFSLKIFGLVIGVIIGGIITIQPLIKFFSDD